MSTKIYGGAIFPKMSLDRLFKTCSDLQNKMIAAKEVAVASSFAERFTDRLDVAVMKKSDNELEKEGINWEQVRSDAWYEFTEEIRENDKGMFRHPSTDFESQAFFYPMKNKILAIGAADHEMLNKVWKDNTVDYHYQNSSDRPDDISPAEWRKRRDDWDKVFGGPGRFTTLERCFGFKFTTNRDIFHMPEWGLVIKQILPYERRKRRQLLNLAIESIVKKEGLGDKIKASDSGRIYGAGIDFINNKDNQAILDEWGRKIDLRLMVDFKDSKHGS